MKRFLKTLVIMALFSSMAACRQQSAANYQVVDATQFAKDIHSGSNVYILDVRTPQEYAEGHIDGAHNLDWLNQTAFTKGAPALPKTDTIYVYCRSGRRSAEAAAYLTKLGYKVVDLDGGYLSWQNLK